MHLLQVQHGSNTRRHLGQRRIHRQCPAQDTGRIAAHVALVLGAEHRPQVHPQDITLRLCAVVGFEHGAELHAQRQADFGGLLQGRRQVDGQAGEWAGHQQFDGRMSLALDAGQFLKAGEWAGHQQFGVAAHDAQLDAIGRLAFDAGGPAGHQTQVSGATQAVGGGHAGGGQAQAAVRLAATFQLRFTPVHPRRAGQVEALVREIHAPARAAQQRHVGTQPQVAAGQLHMTLDGGLVQAIQWQAQRQLQLGLALGRGSRQRTIEPAAHRTGSNIAYKVSGRPLGMPFELQHRVLGQVADPALHIVERHAPQPAARVADLHGAALEQQLAVHLAECGPGRCRCRRRRHAVQGDVLHLCGNAEFAVAALDIREVPQVALDAEGGAGHRRNTQAR